MPSASPTKLDAADFATTSWIRFGVWSRVVPTVWCRNSDVTTRTPTSSATRAPRPTASITPSAAPAVPMDGRAVSTGSGHRLQREQ